jgi:hypothetical protein
MVEVHSLLEAHLLRKIKCSSSPNLHTEPPALVAYLIPRSFNFNFRLN